MVNTLLNNKKLFEIIFSLYDRWEDEKECEDFNDFSNVMKRAVENIVGKIDNVKATKKPFGIKFTKDGKNIHLFVKIEKGYVTFNAKHN